MIGDEKQSRGISSHGGKRLGSGRPMGAPNRLSRPIKELAANYGPDSIAKLVQLRDGAESEQVQFAAAKELLDRANGRPRQEIDLKGDMNISVTVNALPPTPRPVVIESSHNVPEEMIHHPLLGDTPS